MRDYRRLYRNSITGQVSDKIYDLPGDELTLNRKYIERLERYGLRHIPIRDATLFNEISVVPYEEVLPSYWFDLMRVKPLTVKTTFDDFVDGLQETMLKFVYENWHPDKFHFILHSSGWDSRMISAALWKAYENLGREGFGEFVFVCWGDEAPVFKKIMERKGWKKRDYITLPHHDDAFYSYFSDFKKSYKYFNGLSSYPLNEIYWALDILRNDKRIPRDNDKLEMWFASHGNRVFNEVIGRKRNIIKEYLDKNFYDVATNYYASMPCKVVIPIINQYTMKHIIESKFSVPKGVKLRISGKLNPELKGLPRIRIPTGQLIPKKHLRQIKRNYENSWYGKNIKQGIEVHSLVERNSFWLHWSAASLVDYFISKGVNITKGG